MPRVRNWMDEADEEDFRAEERIKRRHRRDFLKHPHCDDPEHPGCSKCNEKIAEGEET